MRKLNLFLTAAFFAIVLSALPSYAQRGAGGRWEWKSPVDHEKRADYISIELKPRNGKVAGTFFYNELDENGHTESDGGVTAFIGVVTGNTVKIEFDPDAEAPGYTEHLRYKKPKGQLPGTATLTLTNGRLVWTQTHGSLGKGIPRVFTLRRETQSQRGTRR